MTAFFDFEELTDAGRVAADVEKVRDAAGTIPTKSDWANLPAPRRPHEERKPISRSPSRTLPLEEAEQKLGHDLDSAADVSPDGDAGDTPRIIWTYWDQGFSEMPEFNKLCIETWKVTNPSWRVVVLDWESASSCVSPGDLPPSFDKMKRPQHRADCVKLAVLRRRGGVWMDSSMMLWQDLVEAVDWEQIENNATEFVAFFLPASKMGPSYASGKQYVENYFLGCRRGCKLITAWHDVWLSFWRWRTEPGDINSDPFFNGVELGHIENEMRGYLTQHCCYKKLLDLGLPGQDKQSFQVMAEAAYLLDSSSLRGPFWVQERIYSDARKSLNWARIRKKVKKRKGDESDCYGQHLERAVNRFLLKKDHIELVKEISRNKVPMAKFTAPVGSDILGWEPASVFRERPCTVRRLFDLAFLGPSSIPECSPEQVLPCHAGQPMDDDDRPETLR
eukprot:gnl/TRDRNA2_/TRDRNA2_42992_c0_seq1.p1 gnl/TRDRNA2_/TRDRNA2_42992_c0~~gnl/TRDRNA2_/TRDRNA2_42992_c0_seq1.p1  ORF type:complete len:448 (+),score=84.44 gnl/TRDRNA2_/TRDRNA2_42992_c0_seq1:140-1483(+)